MLVRSNFQGNYRFDPLETLYLQEFDDGVDNHLLIYGLGSRPLNFNHESLYWLDFELPIPQNPPVMSQIINCQKVFNLCPITSDWINSYYGDDRATSIFFPFNIKHLPKQQDKQFDVCYTGNLNSAELKEMLSVAKSNCEKYCCVAFGRNDLITHSGVDYTTKLDLTSKSKISLIHNWVWINDYCRQNKDTNPIRQYEDKDDGFCQLKSRTFEAAFCRSLMLVRRDRYNIIERFFKPNIDFVYFDGLDDLAQKIKEILADYDNYQPMIESAYNKAINNYTTRHFYDRYLKPH